MPEIKMLTIKEAAQAVEGLTEYRVRAMCLDGTLPCVKAGKKYLICDKVLYAVLCNQSTEKPMKQASEECQGVIKPIGI